MDSMCHTLTTNFTVFTVHLSILLLLIVLTLAQAAVMYQWKKWSLSRYDVIHLRCSLTMSSRSVRCTPNFFKPIVKSLTQMPPSPFTSRTWNSTLNLCSCSDPPHMSQWCDAWPESGCQRATGCRTVVFAFSEYAHPPSGSTPEGVSEDRHWQNICKGGINEPCWCICKMFTLFQPH